jgi:hypothetical protein
MSSHWSAVLPTGPFTWGTMDPSENPTLEGEFGGNYFVSAVQIFPFIYTNFVNELIFWDNKVVPIPCPTTSGVPTQVLIGEVHSNFKIRFGPPCGPVPGVSGSYGSATGIAEIEEYGFQA